MEGECGGGGRNSFCLIDHNRSTAGHETTVIMSDIEFTMSNPHASDRALMKKSSSSAIGKEKKAEETGGKLKFTDEERAEMENAFNLMCAGSTNISAKEVGMTMRKLGQNPTEKELEEMIAEVDLDDYGAVNRKNFMKLMLRKIKGGAGGNNEIDINREAFEV